MVPTNYNQQLENWIKIEKTANTLSNVVGELLLKNSTELVLFRSKLSDQSNTEILNLHKYSQQPNGIKITVDETLKIAESILKLDIKYSKIDLGKLAVEWHLEQNDFNNLDEFIKDKLANFLKNTPLDPKDVVLYGFGRIGRLVARELISQAGAGSQLRLRAIVTRKNSKEDLIKRASLLKSDSVHGKFSAEILEDFDNNCLIINGRAVHFISAQNPSEINYNDYDINNALVIDNTGAFRDKEALSLHLKSKGVNKVLLTAPGKGVPNIVFGINHEVDIDKQDIFSAASCTTNAITPILDVIENEFQIKKGHIETIHAYTNDQNLVDNMHSKYRRGRAAALNMVITETGAGKAVTKAIPSLEGKLTSSAIRVPTPNGSLVILNLTLDKKTNVDEINNVIKKAAHSSRLIEQIRYSFSNELVSSDIVGDSCSSIYDSPATQVSADGQSVVLYVWYDNEYGYTRQVIRLAKYIAKVRRNCYY
ncbi:MAG: glyceraldehyde-3-phosphate dehydrogenase [Flavobacteriales bacterium]